MLKINKNIAVYFIPFFFLALFSIGTNKAVAATINFSPSGGTYHVGDSIKIKVIIASDKSVNATSANVSFPTNILSLTSLSKSSSIVSLWAQEPVYSNSNGSANFEGVILNGYTGNNGNIITLVFKAKAIGAANLKFNNASILANDGNGTDLFSGDLTTAILNIEKAIEIESLKEEPKVEKPAEIIEGVIEKISEVEITNKLPDNSLLVTIIIILIIILIFIIIFIFFLLSRLRKNIKDQLIKAENIVYKNFRGLEKNIDIHSKKQKTIRIEQKILKNNDIIDEGNDSNTLKEVMDTENKIIKEIDEIDK